VTLATRVFGRGTDFVSWDNELNDKGGVHVLQSFLSSTISEEIQIQGRSARQGQRGSYGMVILLEDQQRKVLGPNKENTMEHKEDTLARFNVTAQDLQTKSQEELYDFLNKKRLENRAVEGDEMDLALMEASERDKISRAYFGAINLGLRSSSITLAKEKFKAMNDLFLKYSSVKSTSNLHIVMVLDESGSMAGTKFAELHSAYQEFMQRRTVLNDDDNDDILSVIMFDHHYRLIVSQAPLESYPSLSCSGGGTMFSPALTKAKSELRQGLQKGNRDPVLILMTDGMCGDPAESYQVMQSIDDDFKNDNLQNYFVAFGTDANISILNSLRDKCTNGNVSQAAVGELADTFQTIADSISAEYHS
jgi:uncharacterized protein YegL